MLFLNFALQLPDNLEVSRVNNRNRDVRTIVQPRGFFEGVEVGRHIASHSSNRITIDVLSGIIVSFP
jgi:hypothetical protein